MLAVKVTKYDELCQDNKSVHLPLTAQAHVPSVHERPFCNVYDSNLSPPPTFPSRLSDEPNPGMKLSQVQYCRLYTRESALMQICRPNIELPL
jgi:hypothetical protein